MLSSRRGFISGLVSLIAAPAIVRVENIMPVRAELVVGSVDTAYGPMVFEEQWAHECYALGYEAIRQKIRDLLFSGLIEVRFQYPQWQ